MPVYSRQTKQEVKPQLGRKENKANRYYIKCCDYFLIDNCLSLNDYCVVVSNTGLEMVYNYDGSNVNMTTNMTTLDSNVHQYNNWSCCCFCIRSETTYGHPMSSTPIFEKNVVACKEISRVLQDYNV